MEAEDRWEFKVSLSCIVTLRLVKAIQEEPVSNSKERKDGRKGGKKMESRKQGRIPNYKQCLNPSLIKMSILILLRFIPRRREIIKVGRRKLEHCFLDS